MDKDIFVIALAVATAVFTTLLQVFLHGRELSPKVKRLLWITLVAGIIALIAVSVMVFGR
jgi:hypothetical protein